MKLQHDAKNSLNKKESIRFDSLRNDIFKMSNADILKADQKQLMVEVINILESLAHDAKTRGK